jgi:hypothetical protein
MTKLIRKYQKQLLAVFGVLLMVIFIIPSSMKSGRSFERRPIGHIGTEAVYNDDKLQAANDWQSLQRVFAQVPFLPQNRYSQELSLEPQPAPYPFELGLDLCREIEENPDLYFLLQNEARRRGIQVSMDEVGTTLANELFVSSPDSSAGFQKASPETVGGEDRYEQIARAVSRFLPVLTLVRQLESDVKITEPMWDHSLAGSQLVRLAIAELHTDQFKTSVGIPTPEQIQAQYDKYRDVVPQPSSTDATRFNFGYKIPERVRLQYLKIPRSEVMKAVRASRSAYDWEVDARVYYYAHQDEFVGLPPATEPATEPTTKPAAGPATATASTAPTSAPTTATATTAPATPTTRPFAEVREKAMTAILAAPTDELSQKIQAAIAARLSTDFAAKPASDPTTTAPATVPATGLASKAYLEGVAIDIQKQFNVLPEVDQTGSWLDAAALAKLPEIGGAFSDAHSFVEEAIPATQPSALGKPVAPLALLQPSDPMKDANSNIFIFRIVERQPAHTPPLKEISTEVAAEVQAEHRYQAALDAAKALMEASRGHLLSATAGLRNIAVVTTPRPFAPGSEIPGYTASTDVTRAIGTHARDLLRDASAENPHPLALIELPADNEVLVLQLVDVAARISPDEMYFVKLVRTRQDGARERLDVAARYFSYDAVKSRLNYTPVVSDADKSGS